MKNNWNRNLAATASTTVKSPPPEKEKGKLVRKNSYLTTVDAERTETNQSHSKRSKYTSSSKLTKSAVFRTFSKANFRENQERVKK